MSRSAVIDLIRDALGFNTALSEAIILRHMDLVQHNYERGSDMRPLPWFLFDPEETVTTVASQRNVTLPTGFIDFDEDWPLTIFTTDGEEKELQRLRRSVFSSNLDETGFPTAFDTDYSSLYLWKKPDAVYTINVPCYKESTALSTITTGSWFTELKALLIEEVAFSIAKAMGDKNFLSKTDINQKRADYITLSEAKKHTLTQYKMGGHRA